MASIVVAGDTSGTVTLAAPAVSGTTTLTLPTTSGTVMVNGPAFSAYANANQSFTATTTKVLFQVEEFDTNNNFASSRFTPTVAGYYQVNAAVEAVFSVPPSFYLIIIGKNGTTYKYGSNYPAGTAAYPTAFASGLVYCNGSTDYIEIFTNASQNYTSNATPASVYFSGAMVRSA
jgi:hypothetical protein